MTTTSGVPTAVHAGLAGPPDRPTPTAGSTGNGFSDLGGILMVVGGMLLAGGATASLRRHGRHTR
ncbi:hypothetical protein [Kribbella solani]|uniref:hypothetical protein n=1 Tax=Kribbella solani TaxID=236067 RepID=UPI0029AA94B6|nr:hypothetical protein [Kribbella solani]MDX2970435.1 hypothetical protein [Kribbella solani]